MQAIPIEIKRVRLHRPHSLVEVVVDDLLLSLMLGNPSVVVLKPKNVVLPSPRINQHVKKLRVSIALFDVGNASTLPLPRSFHHRKGKDLPLQTFAKINLVVG
jgi:hypothetical protein